MIPLLGAYRSSLLFTSSHFFLTMYLCYWSQTDHSFIFSDFDHFLTSLKLV